MFLQKGAAGLNLSSIQMAPANAVQQGATFNMQGQLVSPGPLQSTIQQQHTVQPQSQQQTLLRDQSSALTQVGRAPLVYSATNSLVPPLNVPPLRRSPLQSQRSALTLQPQQNQLSGPLYNTMMIPQQSSTNVVQIATSLAQNTGPNTPAVATFAQERATQIRQVFLAITTVSFVQQ